LIALFLYNNIVAVIKYVQDAYGENTYNFYLYFLDPLQSRDTASDMLAVVRIVNALFAIFNRSSQYNNDN
jgi:hypothetical protein